MRTIMDALIDQACGRSAGPPLRRALTAEQKETAQRAMLNVLHHIDTMYPAMWKGVPKSARTSLRNTILKEVETALLRIT